MRARFLYLATGVFACALCMFVFQAMAQTQTTQDTTPEDPGTELMRRYAEKYLKLTEVQLELRLEANRKSPKVYPANEISRYRMNVEVARERLRLVTAPDSDTIELHFKYAQEKAKVAEELYQNALKAKAKSPSAFSELKIRELQLKAEVAQLRLDIWSSPGADVLSILDHMHWQIERVSEEVLDLQRRVDKLSE